MDLENLPIFANSENTENAADEFWKCSFCGTENLATDICCDSCQVERILSVPEAAKQDVGTNNEDSLKVTPFEWYDAILKENEGDIISWMTRGQVNTDKRFTFRSRDFFNQENINPQEVLEKKSEKEEIIEKKSEKEEIVENDDTNSQQQKHINEFLPKGTISRNVKELNCTEIGPIHLAILLDQPEVLLLLLNGGSDPNLKAKEIEITFCSGETERYQDTNGLHLALLVDSWRCSEILLAKKTNPNHLSGKLFLSRLVSPVELEKATPLHCLVVFQRHEQVQKLVQYPNVDPDYSCLFNWVGDLDQDMISFEQLCHSFGVRMKFE